MNTYLPPQDPPMPDEPLPGEAELAALYRKLPQNEPDPALDAAVLHGAAQAMASDKQPPVAFSERRTSPRERGDWVRPKHDSNTAQPLPNLSAAAPGRRRVIPHYLATLGSIAALVLVAGLAWHMRSTPSTATTPMAAAPVPVPVAAPALAAAPAEPMPAPPTALPTAPAPLATERPTGSMPGHTSAAVPAIRAQVASANALMKLTAAPAPSPAAEMAAAAAPAATMPPDEKSTAINASDTPTQELDKIQRLFAQHRDDEGRQRLTAFQHDHPEWELPPGLRAQLPKP